MSRLIYASTGAVRFISSLHTFINYKILVRPSRNLRSTFMLLQLVCHLQKLVFVDDDGGYVVVMVLMWTRLNLHYLKWCARIGYPLDQNGLQGNCSGILMLGTSFHFVVIRSNERVEPFF